jgi:hypothetical protein
VSDGAVVVKGIVRGKTVELERAPGLPEGQEVKVTLQPSNQRTPVPGEGLRHAFGAWAEDAEDLDRFLEWNRQQRKQGRRELGE